jgi:hypothetical protein
MEKTHGTDIVPQDFFDNVGMNIKVGLDEVVSVFVSKYEDRLFAQKDALSANIKATKRALEDLDNTLIASIDKTKYDVVVPTLGFFFHAGNVVIAWKNSYSGVKNTITVEVKMFCSPDANARSVFSNGVSVPIPAESITVKENLDRELEQYNAELLEVLAQIKAVGRKERQIRGRISEMKLEQAGCEALLNNADLLRLVEQK